MEQKRQDLEGLRSSSFYEVTFTLALFNLVVQIYRLADCIIDFLSHVLSCRDPIDYFNPLTSNNLNTYDVFCPNNIDLIFKLIEGSILTFAATFGVFDLLTFNPYGLVFYIVVFATHFILLVIGLTVSHGKYERKSNLSLKHLDECPLTNYALITFPLSTAESRIEVLSTEFALWLLTAILEFASVVSMVLALIFIMV